LTEQATVAQPKSTATTKQRGEYLEIIKQYETPVCGRGMKKAASQQEVYG
jgi:hypothetical protein